MVKQLSICGLFKGKVEVVKDAEKRKPGRPPTNKIPQEHKEKRPVGRPKKEKKTLDREVEEKLNEMMSEYLNLDDLAGLVKGVEEGLEGDAKIEPKDKKIRKILENLSTGIHQLYSAIGKKKDDEHVQALTDQVSSIVQSEGIHPQKEMQVIQDAEVLQPSKSSEEIVESCRNDAKRELSTVALEVDLRERPTQF